MFVCFLLEFPLQNFYRFVTGDTDEQSVATFGTLPRQHILTVRLDTPESWNVQAVRAEQDPDNLRCDSGGCGDRVSQRKDVSSVGYNLKVVILCFPLLPFRMPKRLIVIYFYSEHACCWTVLSDE